MNTADRRNQIKDILKQGDAPISASSLAETLGVSRQVVVGDVALLRAAGEHIFATPRGYLLQKKESSSRLIFTVSCKHTDDLLREELYTIVDLGGSLEDVIVEHPVYGELRGNLHVSSRYEADLFLNSLQEQQAYPLCALTGGVHLHTVSCASEADFQRIAAALAERGILFDPK